jgi:intracellular multiplication protein IcmV
MAAKDIFKVSVKTFFNPSGWFGYGQVKQNTNYLWNFFRGMFAIPEAPDKPKSETFQEAMQRYNLTPAAIAELGKDYLFFAIMFVLLAISMLLFSFYLLIVSRTIPGFLLGLAVSMLLTSQGFRYHFWYFQIKQQKLGCTFDEWWQALSGGKPRPKT